jgi:hypothetical protein
MDAISFQPTSFESNFSEPSLTNKAQDKFKERVVSISSENKSLNHINTAKENDSNLDNCGDTLCCILLTQCCEGVANLLGAL